MGYIHDTLGDILYKSIKDVLTDEIIIAYARIAYIIDSDTLADCDKIALINAYIMDAKIKSPLWRKHNVKGRCLHDRTVNYTDCKCIGNCCTYYNGDIYNI